MPTRENDGSGGNGGGRAIDNKAQPRYDHFNMHILSPRNCEILEFMIEWVIDHVYVDWRQRPAVS